MDNYNREIEQWARQQRDHFHDSADDINNPNARVIYNSIRKIEDSAQAGHNLRSLHDQMRVVERQLEQAKHDQNGFMSINHAEDMFHTFRDKGNEIRQYPHY